MDDYVCRDLVRRFEEGTLPLADWTHAAHLVVALTYLRRQPHMEAVRRLRQGIQRFNRVVGKDGGYHETITLAWAALIRRFLRDHDRGQPLGELAAGLTAALGDPKLLFQFYTRDRLLSEGARRAWTPPDLAPLEAVEPVGVV